MAKDTRTLAEKFADEEARRLGTRLDAAFALDLGEIEVDHDLQPRKQLSEDVIVRYLNAMVEGATFPPVALFDVEGRLLLVDGFHRVEAARRWHAQGGRSDIQVLTQKGTRTDALLFAVAANDTHGLQRSNADKRRCVEMLLALPGWADKSAREVAKAAAVDHHVVLDVRADRRPPVPATPAVDAAATPYMIAEWRGLPLSLLHQAGRLIQTLTFEDPGLGGRLYLSVAGRKLCLDRGSLSSPYRWYLASESDGIVEHVGSTMSKTRVTEILRALTKPGAEVTTRVVRPVTLADCQRAAAAPKLALPVEPPLTAAEAPPPPKSKIPAPKPPKVPAPEPSPGVTFNSASPATDDQAPDGEMSPELRRTWTVLTSISESMGDALTRAEACWTGSVKQILSLAKGGAKPLRSVDLSRLRSGEAFDGDEILNGLKRLRRQLDDLTPYRQCGCPPERLGGGGQTVGGATAAGYCLDCAGRGWLSRSEAQAAERRTERRTTGG